MDNESRKIYIRTFIDVLSETRKLIGLPPKEAVMKQRELVNKYKYHYIQVPDKLYRYARLNKYTFDSISNKYLYLSPATSMDDNYECFVSNEKHAIDNAVELLNSEYYYSYFVKKLLENKDIFDTYSFLIFDRKRKHDKYDAYYKAKYIFEDHHSTFDDLSRLLCLVSEYDNSDEIRKQINNYIKHYVNTVNTTGFACLTENKYSQVMWNMYADNYKGCMIEYDFSVVDELNIIDITPVLYKDDREIDPLIMAIDSFLDSYELGIDPFDSISYRTYLQSLTKDTEWSFEHEWRIIGNVSIKSAAPLIRAIYLGNKVSKCDERKIIKLAKKCRFLVYKQKFSESVNKINYELLYETKYFLIEKQEIIDRPRVNGITSLCFNEYESYICSIKTCNYLYENPGSTKFVTIFETINGMTYSILEKDKITNKITKFYDIKYYDVYPSEQEIKAIVLDSKYKYDSLENKDINCSYKTLIFADDSILNSICRMTIYNSLGFNQCIKLVNYKLFEERYEIISK